MRARTPAPARRTGTCAGWGGWKSGSNGGSGWAAAGTRPAGLRRLLGLRCLLGPSAPALLGLRGLDLRGQGDRGVVPADLARVPAVHEEGAAGTAGVHRHRLESLSTVAPSPPVCPSRSARRRIRSVALPDRHNRAKLEAGGPQALRRRVERGVRPAAAVAVEREAGAPGRRRRRRRRAPPRDRPPDVPALVAGHGRDALRPRRLLATRQGDGERRTSTPARSTCRRRPPPSPTAADEVLGPVRRRGGRRRPDPLPRSRTTASAAASRRRPAATTHAASPSTTGPTSCSGRRTRRWRCCRPCPIVADDHPMSIEKMEEARRLAEALCGDGRVLLQGEAFPQIGELGGHPRRHGGAGRRPPTSWRGRPTPTSAAATRSSTSVGTAFLGHVEELAAAGAGPAVVVRAQGLRRRPRRPRPGGRRPPRPHLRRLPLGLRVRRTSRGPSTRTAAASTGCCVSLRDAGIGPGGNVYAELGSTWFNVLARPRRRPPTCSASCSLAVGPERILWGTDSIWYGSPQDQIEAFRAFEITAEAQEHFGYPALTAGGEAGRSSAATPPGSTASTSPRCGSRAGSPPRSARPPGRRPSAASAGSAERPLGPTHGGGRRRHVLARPPLVLLIGPAQPARNACITSR